jgi:uncharacterized protein (TIGR00369 family)
MDLNIDRATRAVGQYFAVSQREIGDWANGEIVLEGSAPVAAHLRGANRGARAGAIAAMVDNVGGLAAGLAASPDGWVVSTNITTRLASLDHVGPLRLRAEILRRGRASVVDRVQVFDDGAGGAHVAEGVLTSAVLVPDGGPPSFARPVSMAPDGVVDAPPFAEWLDVRRDDHSPDEHALELDLRDELRNPWGIMHGAVVSALVDLAAVEAVSGTTGSPAAAADITLHFLAPGRIGPVAARTTALGERPDGVVVRVEIVDRGANDRRMALAVATVRDPQSP